MPTGAQPMRYKRFSPATTPDGPEKHGADGRGLLLGYTFVIPAQSRNCVPPLRVTNGGSEGDFQRQYELVRRQGDPATFDEHIAQNPPLGPKMELDLIMRLLDDATIIRHVNNMVWDVVDVSAASHRLLTSDRPVDLDRLNLRAPGGAIMMPISPAKLFVAFNDPRWLSYLRDLNSRRPRDTVGLANRKTVERARRYVWAQDSSQETFIGKHMGRKRELLPLFPNLGERVCA
jgi:hypothetical protein